MKKMVMKIQVPLLLAMLLLVAVLFVEEARAFSTAVPVQSRDRVVPSILFRQQDERHYHRRYCADHQQQCQLRHLAAAVPPPRQYSTQREMMLPLVSSALSFVSNRSMVVKLSLLLTAALTFVMNYKRLLYPNTEPDPDFSEYPLPPGTMGCPFVGRLGVFRGSKDYGSGEFYLRATKNFSDRAKRLWKYYFLGRPLVAVAGVDQIKSILNQEFETDGIESISAVTDSPEKKANNKKEKVTMTGPRSLITESKRDRHSQLRRLVGQAITPSAVSKSVPSLQVAAQEQADKMLLLSSDASSSADPIKMEDVCTSFTLDVAWRQILGLDLSEEEIPKFQRAVKEWINDLVSIQAITGIGVKFTKGYKSRMYLEDLIEKRIQYLEKHGPDTSTLSGMVFATDEEGSGQKLTRDEIVDNAMLLILAGSETSASTLTNAMLFLGLHPEKWQKLVQEQRELQAKYGDELSKEMLDKESPYLEAVIKESMRIRPLSGGIPRRTKKTMIVDEKQIPKGWVIDWNVVLTHQMDPKTYKEDGSHMDVMKGFQPERWLKQETTPTEFIPMGAGPRYCLGANLAYAEMKVFLAVMARSIDYSLARRPQEKVRWKPMSIIPKEENGVLVNVKRPEVAKVSL